MIKTMINVLTCPCVPAPSHDEVVGKTLGTVVCPSAGFTITIIIVIIILIIINIITSIIVEILLINLLLPREASVPRATGVWSDSLPRKDLFANNTGSLPRRDKAGLGRPEPPPTAPKPQDQGSQGHQGQHGQQGGEPLRLDGGPQLNRDNPFRDTILGGTLSSGLLSIKKTLSKEKGVTSPLFRQAVINGQPLLFHRPI